jgi:sulfoxide reductase heme-binding subunit YedZ
MATVGVSMVLINIVRFGFHHTLAGGPSLWYLTRTTADAAYVTLTLSVLLGTMRSIARVSNERMSWVVDELHAVLATLTGLLMVAHLVAIKFDSYLPFSLANILLPGNQPYRAFAVDLGVFAMYGMVLVLVSSWLRKRMSYRVWRMVHYLSFVTFVLVTAHGWLAGSDNGEVWQRALYGSATGVVGFLLVLRLVLRTPSVQPAK